MNYPVWYLPETGGGFYLVYSEKKGFKENSEPILDFTKKHARYNREPMPLASFCYLYEGATRVQIATQKGNIIRQAR